jgi:hypothetical protein
MQDVVVLPVPLRRNVVNVAEERAVLCTEYRIDLGGVPDVELALDTFRVGIVGGGEDAAAGDNLVQDPVAGIGDARGV